MAVLDIQVLYVERVFLDELTASFNVFAHQRGEDGLALGDVFKFDREQVGGDLDAIFIVYSRPAQSWNRAFFRLGPL
jgi:hypothetical protein